MVSVHVLFLWHDTTWNHIELLFLDGQPLGGTMVQQDAYNPHLLNVYKATVNTLYRCVYEQTHMKSNDIDACTLLSCSSVECTTERLFPYVSKGEIVYYYMALCTEKPFVTAGQWIALEKAEPHRVVEYATRLVQYQRAHRTVATCTQEPMLHPDPYQQHAPMLPLLPMPYPALSYFLRPYVTKCKPLVDTTNVLAFTREELETVVHAMEKGLKIELVFPTLKLHKKGDFYTFNEVRAYVRDPLVHERWQRIGTILMRYPAKTLFPHVEVRNKMSESLTCLALASLCEKDDASVALYTEFVQWLGGRWDKEVLLFVQFECANDVPISQQIKTIIQSLNVISAPYHVQRIRSLLLARTPPEEIVQMGIRNQLTVARSPVKKARKHKKSQQSVKKGNVSKHVNIK